jgi:hypothetical protein
MEPERRKQLFGADLAEIGLADSPNRLNRLSQLSKMQERTAPLGSSRRANPKNIYGWPRLESE